jgi:hypothetical protein
MYNMQNVGFLDRMIRGLLGIDLMAVCFLTSVSSPLLVLLCLVEAI